MTEQYIDKEALMAFLTDYTEKQANATAAETAAALRAYLSETEKQEIVRCRNCNTFSTAGVAEGYGWCKKFCFGPETNFFCMMGAPWDEEPESAEESADAADVAEDGGNA